MSTERPKEADERVQGAIDERRRDHSCAAPEAAFEAARGEGEPEAGRNTPVGTKLPV